jgi:adenylate cyclase
MAYLRADIGGQAMRYSLATDRIIHIGRSETNDIVLRGDSASRRHAMLQYSESEASFYIVDLGSRNGTFVNDARIAKPEVLRSGDRIRVGNTEFTYHQTNELENSTVRRREKSDSTNVVFEQSLITVLVADIRGFTTLSQRLDATILSEVTGTLFRETGKVLHALGAWEQKYIGDAVMAVWLHQKSEPELRDLIAVFQGLSKIAEIAAGLQPRFSLDAPVRFGAAINTGPAAVGNAGSIAFSDYTAVGETVNRAFRLESSTKEVSRDLLIGRRTHEFLNEITPLDAYFTPYMIKLKSYDEPVKAYGTDLPSLPGLIASLGAVGVKELRAGV